MAAERPLVAGVGISHPERVLFPDTGATKLDLARYYAAVAPRMLPHVADRPLTLVRCPTGLRAPSTPGARAGQAAAGDDPDCFYLKHSKVWAPPALRRVRIREKTKVGEYLIADSAAALVSLAQMDVLEIHTWNSCFADVERPDRIVIDLDPGEQVGWPAVVAAARLVRKVMERIGLAAFVKTTGGRGLHVVVPLTPRADWAECLEFARVFAETLTRQQPDLYTTRFAKAGREEKILIDYLRNNRTNTSVAAFSTRAKPSAPVSMPVGWSDLSRLRTPARFTMATVAASGTRRASDPWKDYWTTRQTIPRSAVRALERL
jgi:bifunctional non-homologous end joining protein LigD